VRAPVIDPAIWPLDPGVAFLNHGSFGSCPRAVLEVQQRLRERLERQPVQFFMRDLEAMVDAARATLAQFVGANPEDLVFVPNATVGVNTVLHSLRFKAGDELLVTDHEYNACRNAFEHAAERSGARVVVVPLPFPLRGAEEIVAAILERVTRRTRLALIDHVTSQTGLVLPIETLVRELQVRGVDTVVDGAHAPGMVPLDLHRVGAAYYTGNCHKWLCAPKGAAFLCVRRDRQPLIRPLVISHGANSERTDRSRYLIEFGWTGTGDPTASLCVPEALRFMGSLLPGGWPEVMRRNRELALAARRILCTALGIEPPAPEELIGTLVSVPIADAKGARTPDALHLDPLQEKLLAEHAIEVPVITWPLWPHRLLRISAQLYNSVPQYEQLAAALRTLQ
jgi:isopenicillin-N epimerase